MQIEKIRTGLLPRANAGVARLMASPRGQRALGRSLVLITYTGRRSGRTISTPVAYRRRGDEVTIDVVLADRKVWWRNFVGESRPLSLRLDGVDRPGRAIAERDDRGRVRVRVQLDQPAG